MPLVATRFRQTQGGYSENFGGLVSYANNQNGSWGFTFSGVSTAGTLDYYIFDRPQLLSGSQGYGLKVADAQGRLTFHSGHKYLRAYTTVSSSNIDTDGTWATASLGQFGASYAYRYRDISLPAGRTYAVINMTYTARSELTYSRGPGGDTSDYVQYYDIFQMCHYEINGGIRFIEKSVAQAQFEQSSPITFIGPNRRAMNALIVDVTGL
ncbi:MAG: hypothetical protein ACSLE1_15675 [Sphingobium sp.]